MALGPLESDRAERSSQPVLRPLGTILACILTALAGLPLSGEERLPDAARLLAEAEQVLQSGDAQSALALLRQLRGSFPTDPLVPDSFAISVRAAMRSGDTLTARYLLQRLIQLHPESPAAFAAAIEAGDGFWEENDWVSALPAYRGAIDAAPQDPDPARNRALVRAADIELHRLLDENSAREHWRAAVPSGLEAADLELYRRLRVRLAWEQLSPAMLGLPDANISSLAVDGDDLWVGTWNGGTSRWSLSARAASAFPTPESPRDFEPTDRRVWVATFSGLAYYSRGTGAWAVVPDLGSSKVQALATAGGELYAGTLGDGLLRLRGDRWQQVGDEEWPGLFITSLAADGPERLLVGTMDLGLLVLDTATDRIEGLSELAPSFTARNVTAIRPDGRGRVWIGTYGEGLWAWEAGEVRRFGRDTGEIGDDWVLAICETASGVWFGTFGGGASFLGNDGTWRRLGVAGGLPSLDVAAIAWRGREVFFGTLGAGVWAYWEGASGP